MWEVVRGIDGLDFVAEVPPVVDYDVRKLCPRPYPGHRHGCPNYGKKPSCPPKAPYIGRVLDLRDPVYVVFNVFDFKGHVDRMRARHPEWSEPRLRCCLYWQTGARAELRRKIRLFLTRRPKLHAVLTPEAQGVNITATMKKLDIQLEWPPVTKTYQVALVGTRFTTFEPWCYWHQACQEFAYGCSAHLAEGHFFTCNFRPEHVKLFPGESRPKPSFQADGSYPCEDYRPLERPSGGGDPKG